MWHDFGFFAAMAQGKTARRVLKVVAVTVSVLVAIAMVVGAYISANYKRILKQRLPAMVEQSTDSIYHLSVDDIKVDVFRRQIIAVGVKLWPDSNRVNVLRSQNRYSPNTVSALFAPKVELLGIHWHNILSNKSLDCREMILHNLRWFMHSVKHHPDLSMIEEPEKNGMITRMTAQKVYFLNPKYTLHFQGDRTDYFMHLDGGKTILEQWVVDKDPKKDTNVLIFAHRGIMRPDSFTYTQDAHFNYIKSPSLDFVSDANSVTLKNVIINRLTHIEDRTGQEKLFYNFRFPSIEFDNFNWNKLIKDGVLYASKMKADKPFLDIHFLHDDTPPGRVRMGKFPNQELLRAMKTDIRTLYVRGGHVRYTEPGVNTSLHAVINFDDITATFTNITNIDSLIAKDKNCMVNVHATFAPKTDITAVFGFYLADTLGHFTFRGTIKNLDAADIAPQMRALTTTQIQSFHLYAMNVMESGDERRINGRHAVLYDNLNVVLNKNKDHDNRGKEKKLATFVADKFVIYPANPMPGEAPRMPSVVTQRDPYQGFFYLIWQNMYQSIQKTTEKDNVISRLANTQSSSNNQPQKNGFFHRLFAKLKRK